MYKCIIIIYFDRNYNDVKIRILVCRNRTRFLRVNEIREKVKIFKTDNATS